MIEGDSAASHPPDQSPVNVIVIPLINMLKTVDDCSSDWVGETVNEGLT